MTSSWNRLDGGGNEKPLELHPHLAVWMEALAVSESTPRSRETFFRPLLPRHGACALLNVTRQEIFPCCDPKKPLEVTVALMKNN
ncbi:hypothetical protein Y1Q_0008915 [Alligator mississippiensis]|uniref:Uncharacterized protein n=1 Tax=Alligator mississippiensis TaxID=8496 RepID=A0A151NKK1_ALLMI|nr:hypothetical protein Y1Q_0008915 [Alligator mississippiensis]